MIVVIKQERLLEADPEGTLEIPDFAYNNSKKWEPGQLDALWQDVDNVFQPAAECDGYVQDENAWCSEVVQVILKRGAKLRSGMQVKSVWVIYGPVFDIYTFMGMLIIN